VKTTTRRRATPDPIREDGVGRDVLETRCALLERSVLKQPTTNPEKLAAQKPGGAENPDTSAMGWLSYLQWLSTEFGRGPAQLTGADLRWDGKAIEDMRAALHKEPVWVTLQSGRRVGVYPKGDYAIHRLLLNQVATKWIIERRVALHLVLDDAPTPEAVELMRLAIEAEAQLTAEFLAIITHPSADVPWAEDGAWEHPVPLWMRGEVTTHDLLVLRHAYMEANVYRLNAIAERTRFFASGGDPMPLPAFMGVMADELKVRPEELARRYSRGEIFAMSFAKFEAHERAKQRADRDRAKE
jgi:hypothetical protein